MAMSLTTTNYGFGKYAADDVTSYLTDYNGTMDKIDTTIKSVQDIADEAKATGDANLNNISSLSQGLTATNKNVENLGKTQTAQESEINDINDSITSLERYVESSVINAYNGMRINIYRSGNMATLTIGGAQTSAPTAGAVNAEIILPTGFQSKIFVRTIGLDQAGHKFLFDLTDDGKFNFFYMLDAGDEASNWYGTVTYPCK